MIELGRKAADGAFVRWDPPRYPDGDPRAS